VKAKFFLLGGAIAWSFSTFPISPAFAAPTIDLTILGTTDVHGNIFPTNYFDNKELNMGLAKIGTLIRHYRQENKNTLLVDSGDALQGSQLIYYANNYEQKKPNPMISAMNVLGYEAFALGNHEFNFGLKALSKARKEAKFPFLSANVFLAGTEKPAFQPYLIKEVGGIKVGLIAFTPPGVALWDRANVEGKLEFRDILKSAARYIPELRRKSDVVVALVHAGLGGKYGPAYEGYSASTGLPPENVGEELAKKFPIDVMLLGHTHQDYPQENIGQAVAAQALKWGERIAVVKLKLEKKEKGWRNLSKESKTEPTVGIMPDSEVVKATQEIHQLTQKYVRSAIAETSEGWTAKSADLEDTAIVDLVNEVQREVTRADLSAASIFNSTLTLPKGKISLSQIAALYPYENSLTAVRITGKQLKEYLECSARYYNSYSPGGEAVNPKMRAYNYDMLTGVDYAIDPRKPEGQRISGLLFKGKLVSDEQTFTLAVNSYRQRGGGGYEMLKGAPVVYNKEESIRELLLDSLKKRGRIEQRDVFEKNWQLLVPIDPDSRKFK
jgi:2',3'-cyclic-nucleotide 2'-phosphodiesterase/3'-nucleotidase